MCGSLLESAGIWGNGCPPFWALPFPSAPPLFRFFGDMRLIQANHLAGSCMALFFKKCCCFFKKWFQVAASPKRFCAEWQLPPKHFVPSGSYLQNILCRVAPPPKTFCAEWHLPPKDFVPSRILKSIKNDYGKLRSLEGFQLSQAYPLFCDELKVPQLTKPKSRNLPKMLEKQDS